MWMRTIDPLAFPSCFNLPLLLPLALCDVVSYNGNGLRVIFKASWLSVEDALTLAVPSFSLPPISPEQRVAPQKQAFLLLFMRSSHR